MKKITLLLISCVLASLTMLAQGTSDPDCLPFVKKLKGWVVVSSDFGGDIHFYTYRLSLEGVDKDGKTYLQLYRTKDDLGVVENAGLLREENHHGKPQALRLHPYYQDKAQGTDDESGRNTAVW